MEVTIFCNLITEVTSYHFCLILFIRGKSLGLANLQGEGILPGEKCQEMRVIATIEEVCLSRPSVSPSERGIHHGYCMCPEH